MKYISHNTEDVSEMLKTCGVNSGDISALFSCIPEELRPRSFELPEGRSELEVERHMSFLGGKNVSDLVYFVGGGFYDHYIPSVIDALVSRSEFYTAYTPYQPEAAQGTLQAIYEFQSSICRLTGMDVSNASLYDGGTALYEAAMMAARVTGRNKVIMDGGVSPIYRNMMYCYTKNLNMEFVEVSVSHGQADREELYRYLDGETACVILQNPNFFGAVDDFSDITEKCRENGALAISSVYPISLGMLKTPGEMGVDIATGEGQSLGIPLSFGGPYLGFMAVRKQLARKMPGRIVGSALDAEGRRGFVLTLQAREQHIRREKATSNICSNQALCALRALIYMCLLGNEGVKELAGTLYDKTEYAKDKLDEIKGVEVMRSSPTFNEFTVRLPVDANEIIGRIIDKGIACGFPLGRYYPDMDRYLLVAVTEKRTKRDITALAEALEEALWK